MKSIKNKILTCVFCLLIWNLSISCQNNMDIQNESVQNGYTNLYVSINDLERTIMPESMSLADLSFKLLGAKTGEDKEVLKIWNNSTDVPQSAVTLKSGTWDFTMNAYLAGKLILTSTKENVFLQGESKRIEFELDEPDEYLGSVDITFEFPVGTGNIPSAKKIVTKLVKDEDEEVEVDSQILIPEDVENDDTKQFVRYQNLNVERGYYFLRFYIYQLENTDYTNFHSTYIRVEPGLESKGNESINSINRFHKITFNLNGGTWNSDAIIPNEFSEFEILNLPIGNVTFESDYWTNASLDGWYEMTENGDLSEVSILTNLPKGVTSDKTLIAKWTIKCVEDDIQQAFDNFPEGRFDIKLTDYHKPVGNSTAFSFSLNDNKKYVGLDYSEANCNDLWNTYAYNNQSLSYSVIYLNLCNVTQCSRCITSGCPNCRKVDFNNSLTFIGEWAFLDNKYITELYLPSSLEWIRESAFNGCINLQNVYFEGTVEDFKNIQISEWSNYYPFDEGVSIICSDGTIVVDMDYILSLPQITR